MAFKPITYAALGLLQLYKWTISPLLGARCRHLPGCSDYARDAIRRFGPWRGGWLTVSRLSRCHPWGSHGFDPVPDHLPDHGWRAWRYGDWAWTERDGPTSSTSDDGERKALR